MLDAITTTDTRARASMYAYFNHRKFTLVGYVYARVIDLFYNLPVTPTGEMRSGAVSPNVEGTMLAGREEGGGGRGQESGDFPSPKIEIAPRAIGGARRGYGCPFFGEITLID